MTTLQTFRHIQVGVHLVTRGSLRSVFLGHAHFQKLTLNNNRETWVFFFYLLASRGVFTVATKPYHLLWYLFVSLIFPSNQFCRNEASAVGLICLKVRCALQTVYERRLRLSKSQSYSFCSFLQGLKKSKQFLGCFRNTFWITNARTTNGLNSVSRGGNNLPVQ